MNMHSPTVKSFRQESNLARDEGLLITPVESTKSGLHFAAPAVKPSSKYMAKYSSIPISEFYWGEEDWGKHAKSLPLHSGNQEVGILIGDGSYNRLEALVNGAIDTLSRIYGSLGKPDVGDGVGLVDLQLSDGLRKWREEQHRRGFVLPSKGFGLKRTTNATVSFFRAEKWPEPLLTANSLFGVGWANLSIGAYDARALYSNYCCDMAFYYEHGYDKVFPEFSNVIHITGNRDAHSLSTFAGPERRKAVDLGLHYIQTKVDLEAKSCHLLPGKAAYMDRCSAQIVSFAESSLIGMAAEAIERGYDPAGVMADMIFSSPATDVIDIGSDLYNSEVMNSLLNTRDIAGSGFVTEDSLRRVYDAYSHTCARMLTERWSTPTGIMNALLYTWHMLNDRHHFFRRVVLGWTKVRQAQPNPREGDMDEVFDANFQTTGFSRPLKNACSCEETCDMVTEVINNHPRHELLRRLWSCLVLEPLEYARTGVVDANRESELVVDVQEINAQCWHNGLVYETNWMICHASLHAWQVNFLMEAAMFGSLLDDGNLAGKLDRATGYEVK